MPDQIKKDYFPNHVAIMMDGNGRWATKRGLPRTAGHYAGMETMRKIIRSSNELMITHLTLYAFSSENWKRPIEEVEYILSLPNKLFNTKTLNEFDQNNIRVRFIGDLSRFSNKLNEMILKVEDSTKNNSGMTVNFALNYGGRLDVINGVKKLIQEGVKSEDIDQGMFESYLYTDGQPRLDLIIRTSGELRLSNFLLWQAAGSELWFTETLWPDFSYELLVRAIEEYRERKLMKH